MSRKKTLYEKLKRISEEEGFECFTPKEKLTYDIGFIESCNVMVSILDNPTESAIFYLGVAHHLKKDIIAYRESSQNIGKMLEGFWDVLPKERKAMNCYEFRAVLKGYKKI